MKQLILHKKVNLQIILSFGKMKNLLECFGRIGLLWMIMILIEGKDNFNYILRLIVFIAIVIWLFKPLYESLNDRYQIKLRKKKR